jgi:VWFA-related protein
MRVLSQAGWLAALLLSMTVTSATPRGERTDPSVRITSPLGRTGAVGTVRVVAQIQAAPGCVLGPVRFYVDGALLGTDENGPPYATEWFDANPFERRELAVEVEDSLGHRGRATVMLDGYEVTEISEVTSVLLEAAVYDRHGRFVTGLKTTDFAVREDGVGQRIDLVDHERVPATFALLIDSSQSMSRRFEFVREAAEHLTAFLRPRDRVIVAPFSRRLGALTGPTDDRLTIGDAIRAIEPQGGTAILDALVELSDRLPAGEDRRAVILITDGYDEKSLTTFEEARTAITRAGLTVYVIGIGGVAGISLKGERVLKRLAADTGGRVFFPPRPDELVGVYGQLALDAQNRYLVTYTPVNTKADGTWRAVTLTTSPEHRVRTRAGYRAPKPAPIRPTLEFTATDTAGRYVEIGAGDLVVKEDGVEQTIDTFQEAVTPVSIVLVLDGSGSMRKSAEALMDAAHQFVDALRPQDQLAVLFFSDDLYVAHALATDRQWSHEAIAKYKTAGGTALYDALAGALATLQNVPGRRAVVAMTDGRDENNAGTGPGSRRTLANVLDLAKKVEATVLPIGLGANVDRVGLERVAETSGGRAFFPAAADELRDYFGRTVENLRRRYVVGYTSTHTARDGSWRTVELRSRSENLVIQTASGYFAPDR